ncbi:hypothetical protein, conserved [Eimeria maxima]|uniref:Uncharacterized protein n=1 Tax=Eimeria maxima TaxID=5804 RepID=U6MFE6_EIMMA|nr:hypothetical protein, conserved [Eimeria maxima]CDJ61773.1 hypothetical protein, conserved [Eimeria maxima]
MQPLHQPLFSRGGRLPSYSSAACTPGEAQRSSVTTPLKLKDSHHQRQPCSTPSSVLPLDNRPPGAVRREGPLSQNTTFSSPHEELLCPNSSLWTSALLSSSHLLASGPTALPSATQGRQHQPAAKFCSSNTSSSQGKGLYSSSSFHSTISTAATISTPEQQRPFSTSRGPLSSRTAAGVRCPSPSRPVEALGDHAIPSVASSIHPSSPFITSSGNALKEGPSKTTRSLSLTRDPSLRPAQVYVQRCNQNHTLLKNASSSNGNIRNHSSSGNRGGEGFFTLAAYRATDSLRSSRKGDPLSSSGASGAPSYDCLVASRPLPSSGLHSTSGATDRSLGGPSSSAPAVTPLQLRPFPSPAYLKGPSSSSLGPPSFYSVGSSLSRGGQSSRALGPPISSSPFRTPSSGALPSSSLGAPPSSAVLQREFRLSPPSLLHGKDKRWQEDDQNIQADDMQQEQQQQQQQHVQQQRHVEQLQHQFKLDQLQQKQQLLQSQLQQLRDEVYLQRDPLNEQLIPPSAADPLALLEQRGASHLSHDPFRPAPPPTPPAAAVTACDAGGENSAFVAGARVLEPQRHSGDLRTESSMQKQPYQQHAYYPLQGYHRHQKEQPQQQQQQRDEHQASAQERPEIFSRLGVTVLECIQSSLLRRRVCGFITYLKELFQDVDRIPADSVLPCVLTLASAAHGLPRSEGPLGLSWCCLAGAELSRLGPPTHTGAPSKCMEVGLCVKDIVLLRLLNTLFAARSLKTAQLKTHSKRNKNHTCINQTATSSSTTGETAEREGENGRDGTSAQGVERRCSPVTLLLLAREGSKQIYVKLQQTPRMRLDDCSPSSSSAAAASGSGSAEDEHSADSHDITGPTTSETTTISLATCSSLALALSALESFGSAPGPTADASAVAGRHLCYSPLLRWLWREVEERREKAMAFDICSIVLARTARCSSCSSSSRTMKTIRRSMSSSSSSRSQSSSSRGMGSREAGLLLLLPPRDNLLDWLNCCSPDLAALLLLSLSSSSSSLSSAAVGQTLSLLHATASQLHQCSSVGVAAWWRAFGELHLSFDSLPLLLHPAVDALNTCMHRLPLGSPLADVVWAACRSGALRLYNPTISNSSSNSKSGTRTDGNLSHLSELLPRAARAALQHVEVFQVEDICLIACCCALHAKGYPGIKPNSSRSSNSSSSEWSYGGVEVPVEFAIRGGDLKQYCLLAATKLADTGPTLLLGHADNSSSRMGEGDFGTNMLQEEDGRIHTADHRQQQNSFASGTQRQCGHLKAFTGLHKETETEARTKTEIITETERKTEAESLAVELLRAMSAHFGADAFAASPKASRLRRFAEHLMRSAIQQHLQHTNLRCCNESTTSSSNCFGKGAEFCGFFGAGSSAAAGAAGSGGCSLSVRDLVEEEDSHNTNKELGATTVAETVTTGADGGMRTPAGGGGWISWGLKRFSIIRRSRKAAAAEIKGDEERRNSSCRDNRSSFASIEDEEEDLNNREMNQPEEKRKNKERNRPLPPTSTNRLWPWAASADSGVMKMGTEGDEEEEMPLQC